MWSKPDCTENKENAAGANNMVLPYSLTLSDCCLEVSQALPSTLELVPVMDWMHMSSHPQNVTLKVSWECLRNSWESLEEIRAHTALFLFY